MDHRFRDEAMDLCATFSQRIGPISASGPLRDRHVLRCTRRTGQGHAFAAGGHLADSEWPILHLFRFSMILMSMMVGEFVTKDFR